VFDPGLGEQVAVGGITELPVEAASVHLRVIPATRSTTHPWHAPRASPDAEV
jgi:hypothetical protein